MKRLLLLVVGLVSATSWAAEFSPGLDLQLQSAQSSDLVSAIVILPSPMDIRALDWKLHEQRASLARRHAEIIAALQYNANTTQPAFCAELEAAKDAGIVTGYTAYWIENLFVIQATKEFLESLRARGDIVAVTENFRAELVEPVFSPLERHGGNPLDDLTVAVGVQACGAYRVSTELGITGEGTIIGSLDTGVDGNWPAYGARWRGHFAPWQECWRDALGGGTTFPTDTYGHGTHMLCPMAGFTVIGVDSSWYGCAPRAMWIADNALNQGVSGEFDNDILDAFQWFADPDGDPGTFDDVPDVIPNSWGVNEYFPGYGQCDARWNAAILNCEASGPVVTWSAGGGGPAPSSLRTPANFSVNAYQMFSVGGVDASDYPNAPYPIASWSGRGPTPCVPASPDNIKPEIVAPGVTIDACGTMYSGTSLAEAHVAGVVALMREACPDCDYITIKDALMSTAIDEGTPGEDNTYGHGFVDAFAAVLAVMPWGRCCYGGGSCVDVTLPECEALNGEWTQGVSCVTGCLESINNLTAYATGGDVVLRWSAVPFATFYRIYTSPTSEEPWTLLDSTTAIIYTHVNGAADPGLSYDVRACSP